MEKPRVLIGSSVCQSPKILERFLESAKAIDVSAIEAFFLFINDNQDEISSELLLAADLGCDTLVLDAPSRETVYTVNELTHYWNHSLVLRVAMLKNKIISYAVENDFAYLFFIDSDLIIDPNLINHLISLEKEIVSEIFWTAWQPNTMPMPNVWLFNEYEMAHPSLPPEEHGEKTFEFMTKLREPGVYEVGGLGACTLISAQALRKGLNFLPISNLTFWGEDRWFCIRAAAIGVPLYVDTHYPATHLYRESDVV